MFGDGCIWSCFSDNSAGLSATTIHMYLGYGGPTYQITAAKFVGTDLIGDNAPPGTATFQLSGGLAILNSWQANTTNATNGQMGVQITADSNISLGCGGIGATAANWAAQKGNILVDTGGGGGKGGSSNDIALTCISGGYPGWTIAQLPVCNVNAAGLTEFISNGVASPTYNAAVGTTGTSTQSVFCTWNGTTGTWVYR